MVLGNVGQFAIGAYGTRTSGLQGREEEALGDVIELAQFAHLFAMMLHMLHNCLCTDSATSAK